MATTYGYHYGGKINRGERYGKAASRASAPKANLGEGRSAKSNNIDFSDLRAWYAKQDQITKSAMNKAADNPTALFSKEERDSFYRNVDADHYQQYLLFRYPGKTEFIQDRMKSYRGFRRSVEENGLVPKEPSETKPETQYAEQAVKEQANSKKPSEDTASDDPWAKALKAETPAEKYVDPNKAKYSSPEFKRKPLEEQWAEAVKDETPTPKSAETKADQSALDDVFAKALHDDLIKLDAERAASEKQAAQDMVDSSKSNLLDLSFDEKVYRPWAEEYGERARPNSKTVISKREDLPSNQSLTPHIDFTWRENSDNLPFYNKNAVNRHIPDATHAPEFYLNPVEPLAAPYEYGPIVTRKAAEKAYDQKLNREIAIENAVKDGLWGLGILGATAGTFYGLDKLGKYIRQDDSDEQPQTQVPYRMEPEPVSEAVTQTELIPEQQFVLQSTSPFDYAKGANLFDLYDRYGSPDSIDNSIPEEQSADENTLQPDSDTYKNAQEMGQRIASGTGYAPELKKDNFEFPQNPPKVGSSIKTAGLKSPNGGEVPQELNRLSGVKPRVIKDTSNGPVVLNDPNHRKTRNVQNNPVTPERVAANQMVNQYAGIPVEVVRAKNQPFLTTDAIWNRLRQKGLVSPEEGIRSGLFTPDEVRYITENDLWRYR